MAQAIAETEGVELTGVYAHCGNTYNCRGVEPIQAVAQETTNLTLQFMEKYDKSEKKTNRGQSWHMLPATENGSVTCSMFLYISFGLTACTSVPRVFKEVQLFFSSSLVFVYVIVN